MKTEKTIREWLNELPEPYRTQALANENNDIKIEGTFNDLVDKQSEAVLWGFEWGVSPEGDNYWNAVHDKLLKEGK